MHEIFLHTQTITQKHMSPGPIAATQHMHDHRTFMIPTRAMRMWDQNPCSVKHVEASARATFQTI
eukprot:129781-Amphidinium_carterae.1